MNKKKDAIIERIELTNREEKKIDARIIRKAGSLIYRIWMKTIKEKLSTRDREKLPQEEPAREIRRQQREREEQGRKQQEE